MPAGELVALMRVVRWCARWCTRWCARWCARWWVRWLARVAWEEVRAFCMPLRKARRTQVEAGEAGEASEATEGVEAVMAMMAVEGESKHDSTTTPMQTDAAVLTAKVLRALHGAPSDEWDATDESQVPAQAEATSAPAKSLESLLPEPTAVALLGTDESHLDAQAEATSEATCATCAPVEPMPLEMPSDESHVPAQAEATAAPVAPDAPAATACAAPVAGPLTYAQHRSLQKARRRAGQRWCRWLTAAKSRIGHTNGLRKRLGKARWAAFVAYANTHFKPAFVAKFGAPMGCAGPLGHAAPCPNGSKFAVDPTQIAQVEGRLATLHLDHRRDLVAVCEAWKAAMPTDRPLRSWHDGVDPDLVCHLLFGVADHPRAATASDPSLWRANVEFRCGASKQHKAGNFCHQMWGSHDHRHPVTAEMLRV